MQAETTPLYGPPAPENPENNTEFIDLTVQDFVEYLGDDILASESAWKCVDNVKRVGLTNKVNETIESEISILDLPTNGNREFRRLESNVRRDVRELFANGITYGQYAASILFHGDEDSISSVKEQLDLANSTINPENYDEDFGPRYATHAQLTLDVVSAFINALEIDQNIIKIISSWISDSPEKIQQLIKWMDSDQAQDLEFRPLLETIARHHLDPNVQSLFDGYFEQAYKNPTSHQESFINVLMEHLSDEGYEDDPVLSWMHYLFIDNGNNLDTARLIELLSTDDIETLPTSLANMIKIAHKELTAKQVEQFEQCISKYDKPSHHLTFGKDAPGWRAESQKPHKRKGKRKSYTPTDLISHKNAARKVVTTESDLLEPEPITKVYRGAQTTDRYVAQELQDGDESALDALMSSKIIVDYIQDYRSVPNFETDVQNMLDSILVEPRGNGATKMGYKPILFEMNGSTRKLKIWHLNPVVRRSMPSGSSIARDTRIYYCTWPNGDGTESLILMGINHKQNVAIHNGVFHPTRQ